MEFEIRNFIPIKSISTKLLKETILTNGKKVRVLALSGGGYRGLFTAQVLACIEKETGKPITEYFDLITGTSIGGVIAFGLAAGKRPEEFIDLFKDKGNAIFPGRKNTLSRKIFKIRGFFRPLYKSNGLKKALEDLFKDTKLKELNHAFAMVPCTNILDGQPKFFKTPHSKDLKNDGELKVVDVALATSAAPVYFPSHKIEDTDGIYIDGGIVGNAPGVFGYVEAMSRLGAKNPEDVSVLSIGTLGNKPTISAKIQKKPLWKFYGIPLGVRLGFWLNPFSLRLLNFMFSQSEQQSHNMLKILLKDNYCLIDDTVSTENQSNIDLDDPREEAQLILTNKAKQLSQVFIASKSFSNFFKHTTGERNE